MNIHSCGYKHTLIGRDDVVWCSNCYERKSIENRTSVQQGYRRVKAQQGMNNKPVGFKPAGGVKTAEDAKIYLAMAEEILGPDWIDARHYRFGASSLLTNLLNTLEVTDKVVNTESY